MADTTVDLTDNQIEKLLQEAEARLSAKATGQDGKSLTIPPKMEVVKTQGDTAAMAATASAPADKKPELSVRVPAPKLSKKEFEQVHLSLSYLLLHTPLCFLIKILSQF
jgi:hypothetical protein